MKKPIELGDRVKVFSHYGDYKGTVCATGVISENRYRRAEGLIRVRTDLGEEWTAHPRQCARLKPRPKRDRIRARVAFCEADRALVKCLVFDRLGQQLFEKHTMRAGVTPDGACLSEIRQGEVIVSRDALAKAWDRKVYAGWPDELESADKSPTFLEFCKELGL
jgi:hypothetical protein